MRKLIVFNTISLDGYFTDANGDASWTHSRDAEWNAFTAENAKGGGMLVLGRITYDLMTRFWPTPMAAEMAPVVAGRMNAMPKIVFSRTLEMASWANTTIVKDGLATAIRDLKKQPGGNMTVLGSGSLVSQLAGEGLIDEYQIVVRPIVLGQGRTMFENVKGRPTLRLDSSRTFANGNVLLNYTQP
jgi:dihydrofolate reductase